MTNTAMTNTAMTPFRVDVPQTAVDDLRDRLAKTRWPGGHGSASRAARASR
jgi:hypothetical protein